MEKQLASLDRERTSKVKGNLRPILLCWLVYTAAYLGRYSYASNITFVMEEFGVNHADAGLVTTFFFLAYGAGQILNGIFCKFYPKRWVVAGALLVSAALNVSVFLEIPFRYVKYLWLLNGIVQSIFWPTLTSALASSLPQENLSKSVVIMSSSVALGTFLIYGISALLAIGGAFRYAFLIASVAMTMVAFVWFFRFDRLLGTTVVRTIDPVAVSQNHGKKAGVLRVIAVLCLFAVINNLVKDGLNTWVPSILKEKFLLPDGISVFLTLVLPTFGFFGATFNTILERKIKSYTLHAGLWFLLATICIGAVYILIQTSAWLPVLVIFGLISLFMHGANGMITAVVPLYMRDRANSGLLAGILNGCCYVGSTISSYGLGYFADTHGWNGVFILLLVLCACPVVIAGFGHIMIKRK